jgi:BolA family transcriptional regulator, general stress-responsive regulator
VNRVEQIRETLQKAFAPERLAVHDDSHLHAGHAGAATGKGHFRVEIVSDAFAGMRPLQRHRAVYAALDALMQTEIHALSVSARAPGDVAA